MQTEAVIPESAITIPETIFDHIPLGWAWRISGKKLQRPEHLCQISDVLRKVAYGEIKRLIISAPPRHGKTWLITHHFPAWLFCHMHLFDARVGIVSYGAEFAATHGRTVRDLVNEHSPVKLREDSDKQNEWQFAGHIGGLVTNGAMGGFTGRGFDYFIFDDLVKNVEEALSATYRDKLWNWFQTTAYNRLEPGGRIIITMQRWHVDDVVGRVKKMAEETGEEWTVLEFPAIAEDNDPCGRKPGEALWPERYQAETLKQYETSMGFWFYSQYQQRPVRSEDQAVNPEWFRKEDIVPKLSAARRYFDMAAKKESNKKKGDYASGSLTVRDEGSRYGILDIRRERKTASGIEEAMADTIIQDFYYFKNLGYDEDWWGSSYVFWFESDTGGTGEISASYLTRILAKRVGDANIPVPTIEYEHPSGSKPVRANPMLAQAKAGNYWRHGSQSNQSTFHKVGEWDIKGFLARASEFPEGKYDDEIDGCSGAFAKLFTSRQRGNLGISVGDIDEFWEEEDEDTFA